jgi:hypothetical protein
MSILFPTDRRIRIAAGVAVALFAFTVSAQSRPVRVPVDRDHRGTAAKPLPGPKGTYDPAKATIRDHRLVKPVPRPLS